MAAAASAISAGASVAIPPAGGRPGIPLDAALLASFSSSDNALIQHIEKGIEAMKSAPGTMAAGLLYHATSHADQYVRKSGIVLFRRYFTAPEMEHVLWYTDEGFGDAARTSIKQALLDRTPAEPVDGVNKIFASVVAEIGMMELDQGRWPELMPTVFQWLTSSKATVVSKTCGMRVLSNMTAAVAHLMKGQFAVISKIFGTALANSSEALSVRLAALQAMASLLAYLDEGDPSIAHFTPHALPAVHLAGALVSAGDSDNAATAITLLGDIAWGQAPFFKAIMGSAVSGMLTIADAASLPPKLRKLAMEFVTALAESAPGLARKLPDNSFVKQSLPVLLQAMAQIDPAADTEWDTREEAVESDPVFVADSAAGCLERVLISIGPNASLHVLYPMLGTASSNPDWRYRVAAMCGLRAASSTHPRSHKGDVLVSMAERICKCTADANPRVRHAGAQALGHWAHHHSPIFQQTVGGIVLPAIARLINDSHPRVQSAACMALQEYIIMARQSDVKAMAPGIMTNLTSLLATAGRTVREYSLRAVSALCAVAKDDMAPLYPTALPLLSALATDPASAFLSAGGVSREQLASWDLRHMRGLACDALTALIVAVPAATAAADIPAVVGVLNKAAADSTGQDDPLRGCAWSGLAALAQCSPDIAATVLPALMPALLGAASTKLDARPLTADEAQAIAAQEEDAIEGGMAEETMPEYVTFEDSNHSYGLRVKVASMEEKSLALQLLAGIAHGTATTGTLARYVADIVPVVTRCLTDDREPMSSARGNAAELASDLVLAVAVWAARSGCTPEAAVMTAQPVMTSLLTALIPAISEIHTSPDMHHAIIKATRYVMMEGCLHRATDGRSSVCVAMGETSVPGAWTPSHSGGPSGHLHNTYSFLPAVQPEQLSLICKHTKKAIIASISRIGATLADLKTRPDEFDEEARDDMEMGVTSDEATQAALVEIFGTVMRTCGDAGLAAFDAEASSFVSDNLLRPGASTHNLKLGIFVIDDLLEFGASAAASRVPANLAVLVQALSASTEPDIIQAAAYGVGCTAQRMGPAFVPYAKPALEQMWRIVRVMRPNVGPVPAAVTSLTDMGATGFTPSSTAPPPATADMTATTVATFEGAVDNVLTAIGKILHFSLLPLSTTPPTTPAAAPASPAGAAAPASPAGAAASALSPSSPGSPAAAAAAAAAGIDAPAMLSDWAARQPICNDLIESRTALCIMAERISGKCPHFGAGGPPALARVLSVLSWGLQTPKVCTPFLLRASSSACAALHALGPERFGSVWSLVPASMQKPLEGAGSAAATLSPPLAHPPAPTRSSPMALR